MQGRQERVFSGSNASDMEAFARGGEGQGIFQGEANALSADDIMEIFKLLWGESDGFY